MDKAYKEIDNALTGEVERSELTAKEYAELAERQAAQKAREDAETQAAIDKAALLAKLGITADEAKLLLS
jgi:hypothetical protein